MRRALLELPLAPAGGQELLICCSLTGDMPTLSVKFIEKTPAALNLLCWQRTRHWGSSVSKSQAGLKQGMTSALSPSFKERAADRQTQHRGAWSCSSTSWTSVACCHCATSWLDQLCYSSLSPLPQAHKANTPSKGDPHNAYEICKTNCPESEL